MKKLLLAMALTGHPVWAVAGDFSADARGSTTAGFLKLGAGARAAAMGEAAAASGGDAAALYWNPAGLARVEGRPATFMHAAYLDSSFFDYAAYAHRTRRGGVIGVGVQYFSAGSIKETDTSGTEVGSFTPSDLAASLGYAREIHGYGVGASAKYVQSKILDTARTFALDLGVQSPALLEGKLRLGLAVTNLGGKMKFEAAKEDLPLALRLGGSYKLNERLSGVLDLVQPKDNALAAAIGAEYALPLKDKRSLALRAGYNGRTAADGDGLAGFAFGLGFGFDRFNLDYAASPFGDLGLAHRISVSSRF